MPQPPRVGAVVPDAIDYRVPSGAVGGSAAGQIAGIAEVARELGNLVGVFAENREERIGLEALNDANNFDRHIAQDMYEGGAPYEGPEGVEDMVVPEWEQHPEFKRVYSERGPRRTRRDGRSRIQRRFADKRKAVAQKLGKENPRLALEVDAHYTQLEERALRRFDLAEDTYNKWVINKQLEKAGANKRQRDNENAALAGQLTTDNPNGDPLAYQALRESVFTEWVIADQQITDEEAQRAYVLERVIDPVGNLLSARYSSLMERGRTKEASELYIGVLQGRAILKLPNGTEQDIFKDDLLGLDRLDRAQRRELQGNMRQVYAARAQQIDAQNKQSRKTDPEVYVDLADRAASMDNVPKLRTDINEAYVAGHISRTERDKLTNQISPEVLAARQRVNDQDSELAEDWGSVYTDTNARIMLRSGASYDTVVRYMRRQINIPVELTNEADAQRVLITKAFRSPSDYSLQQLRDGLADGLEVHVIREWWQRKQRFENIRRSDLFKTGQDFLKQKRDGDFRRKVRTTAEDLRNDLAEDDMMTDKAYQLEAQIREGTITRQDALGEMNKFLSDTFGGGGTTATVPAPAQSAPTTAPTTPAPPPPTNNKNIQWNQRHSPEESVERLNTQYFNGSLDLNNRELSVRLINEGIENLKRIATQPTSNQAIRDRIDKDIALLEEMLAELEASE